jgi:hypothetical protein
MQAENQTSVVVISCDAYQDLWEPFFAFFRKFWTDCPYKVYLTSNQQEFNSPGISVVKSGIPSDWSSELLVALEQIPGDYILVMLEDYFMRKPVDTNFIRDAENLVRGQNADYLKVTCFPSKYNELWPYKKMESDPRFARIINGAKYEVCLQVAFWKKEFLKSILTRGESPWQFEIEGSKKAARNNASCLCIVENKFSLGVHGPLKHLCGAVTKGVLMREALRMGRKYNVGINLNARPIESPAREIARRIRIAMPMFVRHGLDFLISRLNRKR